MAQRENHDEIIQAFDQEIKALISVIAEICVHDFLNSKNKETEDVEEK